MKENGSVKLKVMVSEGHQKHNPQIEYQLESSHPYSEQPVRVDLILDALSRQPGIDFISCNIEEPDFMETLQSIHTPEYLAALHDLSAYVAASDSDYLYPIVHPRRMPVGRANMPELVGYFAMDNFAPIGKATYAAALEAARTVFACAEALLDEPDVPVYALVRPPGHHAGPDYMGGYCYLNNAAVAAQRLKQAGRVAILDIDYHHGNGTQEIFWEEPDVLFVSLHGDPDAEYPNYSGRTDEQGGGAGLGMNLNFPLPVGTTGQAYRDALGRALQAVRAFTPDYLVVSLGVDTYKTDPTGKFRLEWEDYGQIGAMLGEIRLPKLFIQEGGYDLQETGNLVADLLINSCNS